MFISLLFLFTFFPSSLSSPFPPFFQQQAWTHTTAWYGTAGCLSFARQFPRGLPRICNPVIDLLECWMPLLPSWVMDNILDQMVLPRLHKEVETWDPTTDTMPIHAWVHPWLPLMGTTIAFCEAFMSSSPSLLALLFPSLLLLSSSLSLPLPFFSLPLSPFPFPPPLFPPSPPSPSTPSPSPSLSPIPPLPSPLPPLSSLSSSLPRTTAGDALCSHTLQASHCSQQLASVRLVCSQDPRTLAQGTRRPLSLLCLYSLVPRPPFSIFMKEVWARDCGLFLLCFPALFWGQSHSQAFFLCGLIKYVFEVFYFYFLQQSGCIIVGVHFYLHVITDGPACKLVGHPWLVKACVQHNCWPPVRMSGGSRFPPHYFFSVVVVELGNPEV